MHCKCWHHSVAMVDWSSDQATEMRLESNTEHYCAFAVRCRPQSTFGTTVSIFVTGMRMGWSGVHLAACPWWCNLWRIDVQRTSDMQYSTHELAYNVRVSYQCASRSTTRYRRQRDCVLSTHKNTGQQCTRQTDRQRERERERETMGWQRCDFEPKWGLHTRSYANLQYTKKTNNNKIICTVCSYI